MRVRVTPRPRPLVKPSALAAKQRARRAPQHLLAPVRERFIWFSLSVGLLLNFLPWWRLPYVPDFFAIILIFWTLHQPRRVGMGAAFGFGLLMDVHSASLLGEHALAYTLLSYFVLIFHRRILWFSIWKQTLHLFPLILCSEAVALILRSWIAGVWPGTIWLLVSVTTAILWPLASWLLLLPQRRSNDNMHPI